jgi:hypothetical protein
MNIMIIGISTTKFDHSDHQDDDHNKLLHTSRWQGQKQHLEIWISEKCVFLQLFFDFYTNWAILNRLQWSDLMLELLFFNLFVSMFELLFNIFLIFSAVLIVSGFAYCDLFNPPKIWNFSRSWNMVILVG